MVDDKFSFQTNLEGGWRLRTTGGVVQVKDPDTGKPSMVPVHAILTNGTTVITGFASPKQQTFTLKVGSNPPEVIDVTGLNSQNGMSRVLAGDLKLLHLMPYGNVLKSSLTAFQQAYENAKNKPAPPDADASKQEKPTDGKTKAHPPQNAPEKAIAAATASKAKPEEGKSNHPAPMGAQLDQAPKPVPPAPEALPATVKADKSSAHNKYPGEYVDFGDGWGVNLKRDVNGEPVRNENGDWVVSTTRATVHEMETGPKREAAIAALTTAIKGATGMAAANYQYMLGVVNSLPHAAPGHAVEHSPSVPGIARHGNHRGLHHHHHRHDGRHHGEDRDKEKPVSKPNKRHNSTTAAPSVARSMGFNSLNR